MPHALYALAAWRQRRGLSVDDLAARAGVSVRTLNRVEQGAEPSYATARAVAIALEVMHHVLTHDPRRLDFDPDCITCEQLKATAGLSDDEAVEVGVRLLTGERFS